MNSRFFRLLIMVLLAAFFFDDPQGWLWKRLAYSAFAYLAVWEMIYIYIHYTQLNFPFPDLFKKYGVLYGLFLIGNIIFTLIPPSFDPVTVINNPYALLASVPVFAYGIGYVSPEKDVQKAVGISSLMFIFCWFIPSFSIPKYYAGYVCWAGVIPGFIFALSTKRNHGLYFLLLLAACVYSQLSDYRIIMLKVLLFFGLFVSLNMFKNNRFIKIIILSVTFFLTIQFVSNLQDFLEFFQKTFHLKDFDADDTRSFLYEELFKDIKGTELIYGRGYLGTYFSKYFFNLQLIYHTYADSFQRFSIEVGFLELILKGGLIYVFFYCTPMLYSSLKSLLSKNTDPLTFNLGIYIMTEFISLFIENVPLFNFNGFLIFFISGLVYRRMTVKKKAVITKPNAGVKGSLQYV